MPSSSGGQDIDVEFESDEHQPVVRESGGWQSDSDARGIDGLEPPGGDVQGGTGGLPRPVRVAEEDKGLPVTRPREAAQRRHRDEPTWVGPSP